MPYGVILAAGVVSGLALWCSNGVLERVTQDDRIVRVALLPPLWVALACCVVAIGAIGALVHLVSRIGQRHAPAALPAASLADLCLPLFATATLVTPYLPHLADWFPALTLLAGPFKGVVWTVVVVLVARAALLRAGASVTPRLSRRVSAMLVFLAGLALYAGAASRLVQTALFPGGDEPHYLVIAQSLWRDGNLRIEDNHRRGDTLEYFNLPLTPHYLTRGKDREIYSIHPIGLAVAAAPVYALGGYLGVVAALVIVAALAGALAWRLACRWTGSASATVGWLACAAGAPSVFNSFTVYPEVPAALATIAAFGLVTRLDATAAPARLALGCGVALATLPWLSSKYVAMAGVLGLLAILRLWPSPASRLRSLALLALVPIVSLALWFAFFQAIWGTPSPSAPYRIAARDEPRQPRGRRPGSLFRSGVRRRRDWPGADPRAGGARLDARHHGHTSPAGDRDPPRRCSPAGAGRRVSSVVGRQCGRGPSTDRRTAAADGTDRVVLRAERRSAGPARGGLAARRREPVDGGHPGARAAGPAPRRRA